MRINYSNKYIIIALLGLFCFTARGHQLTEESLYVTSKAYGYVYAQDYIIKNIENKFNNLNFYSLQFKNKWENRFPKAKEKLIRHLSCFHVTERQIINAMSSRAGRKISYDRLVSW